MEIITETIKENKEIKKPNSKPKPRVKNVKNVKLDLKKLKQKESTTSPIKSSAKGKILPKRKIESSESQAKKKAKDESYCIVCEDSFSNSEPGEEWIQCYGCKEWSHERCIQQICKKYYYCFNCSEDD